MIFFIVNIVEYSKMPVSDSDLIISSDVAPWDNISLAHYRKATAGSLPEHCSLHHEICINCGKPVVLEQIVNGHS